MWTSFIKSTCGPTPSSAEYIYIESDIDTACIVFRNRFGFMPDDELCGCCGMAYLPETGYNTLAEATANERGCEVKPDGSEEPAILHNGHLAKYITLDEYLVTANIELIPEPYISEEDLADSVEDWADEFRSIDLDEDPDSEW